MVFVRTIVTKPVQLLSSHMMAVLRTISHSVYKLFTGAVSSRTARMYADATVIILFSVTVMCYLFYVFYVTGSVSSLPPSPVSWGMDISQVQLRPCWIITAITEQFVECSKSCSNTNWSIVMALNHPLSKWEQFGSESAFKTGKVFCRSSVYRQRVLNGRCNFTASVKGWDTTVLTLHDSSLTVT